MIRTGLDIVDLQHFCKFLYFFARKAVYDTAFAFVGLYVFDNLPVCVGGFRAYFVIEIRTVERRFIDHGIRHGKVFLNVVLYLGRCGGGECYHRTVSDFHDNRTNPAVFRAEIVSPL